MLVVFFVGRVCSRVCSCGDREVMEGVCVLGVAAVIFLLAAAFRVMFRAMPFSFLAFAEFGTGEGLLVYGMDALYRRGAPGVRDAFLKALGAKNRRFRYGRDIRYQKPPPTVRN